MSDAMFENMALNSNKENLVPQTSSDPLQRKDSSPRKKGRSKSIGPGGLEEDDGGREAKKDEMKNRRKSTFAPATRGIIPNQEDAERRAARRKSMANRRVSFAPEATLHTWDVIEYMRDHTTSTDSSESTRRASGITRSSTAGSPGHTGHFTGEEPPSTPPEQADSPEQEAESPAHQRDLHQTKRRRGSVLPPAVFDNEEDVDSSSVVSGSSDVSGSEEEDGSDMEDATATGTAMSLDTGDNTLLSNTESEGSSTSSSARLERNLRQASELAGTRGIEYDEFGEGEESMELAGDETTNAFKPWVRRDDDPPIGSASLDQENVNPFSPAFRAEVSSTNHRSRPSTIQEEDEDMSMDVTRAVGGILQAQSREQVASPVDDSTMDFTQAVGKVHSIAQSTSPATRSCTKRRRSTTDAGSPGVSAHPQAKRRRSSVARSSMGDETMDLTIAMGGIQDAPTERTERRRSAAKRRSSGFAPEQDGVTMDFTRPMGGIYPSKRQSNDSFDENEELTMELTTVLGGIKANGKASSEDRPQTPQESFLPQQAATEANTTPKDQERFREIPDSGPGKLLTPILQKQATTSAEKPPVTFNNPEPASKGSPVSPRSRSREQRRASISPAKVSSSSQKGSLRKGSALKNEIIYPELPAFDANVWAQRVQPIASPVSRVAKTPESELKRQLDAQLEDRVISPTLEKQLRSTPTRQAVASPKIPTPQRLQTPQKPAIPLESTPKAAPEDSATPKAVTPKTATPKSVDPKHETPKICTPKPTAPKSATPKTVTPQVATPKAETPKTNQLRSAVRKPSTPQQNGLGGVATPQETSTPQETGSQAGTQDTRRLADNIKMMSTPRKETLKALTPKKQTPAKQSSPVKRHTPRIKSAHKIRSKNTGSPARQLNDDLVKARTSEAPPKPIRLQEFLDAANIRFMDLTTTKRRMTTMPTPSKKRKSHDDEDEPEITLGSAVVAAACTEPEKELFSHACHELKRYIHEGKGAIKELEAETLRETPPLLQAYMAAMPNRKLEIDAQLRDMKMHARLRSKEMWYGWRGQLLDELMHVLQGIAEGLLKDDETLQSREDFLNEHLPAMLEQRDTMQQQAEELQESANEISHDEKQELEAARKRIVAVDEELKAKRQMLDELRQDAQEQDTIEENLQDTRSEFAAAIQEADRVRESCRTISLEEINSLDDSVKALEKTYSWSITSASSSPPAVTMTYKSSLQLYFHPGAFLGSSQEVSRPNAPIGLTYIGSLQPLSTSLRFFLQLLRASLQALPQCSTKINSLLNLVSSGWDTAISVAESERRLAIEGLTDTRIVSDERLSITASVLVPKMKTKVRVSFDVLAAVGEDLALSESVEVNAKVVYGEKCNEQKMREFVEGRIGGGVDGWEGAVVELRGRLVAKGMKAIKR